MSVVSLCDWLPPDFGAVGQYALLRAREEAQAGHDVVLVGLTSGEARVDEEKFGPGRLRIVRLPAPPTPRKSWKRRLLWTLRTDVRLVRAASPYARRAQVVRFTGSPPFMLPFVLAANRRWRSELHYRITDFWPECALAALDHIPTWLRGVTHLFVALRRRVNRIEVLGEDQRRRLQEQGIPPEQIVLRRDPAPVKIRGDECPLPLPPGLRGGRVILYSGNWGVAHDVDTFVRGYIAHHREGSGCWRLWLNAVGTGADEVEHRLRRAGVPFHRSQPVPLDRLARLLVTPDAHLITLKPPFVGYVLPSKVYGCLASGRPILYVGPKESDIHLLCTRERDVGSYRRVDVGDAAGVAAALEAWSVEREATCVG